MTVQVKVYTRTNESDVHYARIVAPKALRAFVAKPAIWRSLSTKDAKEAFDAGSIVAASAQLVFQEVSDAFAEAAEVSCDVELVGAKFDLAKELDKISQEDIALVAKSLREKFGIKTSGAGKPNGGSEPKSKKPAAKAAAAKKESKETDDAGAEKKLEQDSISLSDCEVEHFIEKRPHGMYRFRYWVPSKLQSLFGQREVRETLKTDKKAEAITRARPLLEQVLQRLQTLPVPA